MPSSKKQRGKQTRLLRKQKGNEERREAPIKKPECRCGVKTDEALLLLSYEHGMEEFPMERKRKDLEDVYRDFINEFSTLCTYESFAKILIRHGTTEMCWRTQGMRTEATLQLIILRRLPCTSCIDTYLNQGARMLDQEVKIMQSMYTTWNGSSQQKASLCSLTSILITTALMSSQQRRNEWKALVAVWAVWEKCLETIYGCVTDAISCRIVARNVRSPVGEFLTVLLSWSTLHLCVVSHVFPGSATRSIVPVERRKTNINCWYTYILRAEVWPMFVALLQINPNIYHHYQQLAICSLQVYCW